MEIRNYQAGDEKGFQKLDQQVELHPWNRRNLNNWNWKFKGNNPAGEPVMIYAEDDDEIIGHFAAIPINYWIDKSSVTGSHSVAMMIAPKWQNRGLIKFIADKLFQQLEEQGICFTYGYPNDSAYDLHINLLGYNEVNQQKLYLKKVTEKDKSLFIVRDNPLKWRKIELFDQSVNDLWENSKHSYNAIVERTAGFLNWRYLERPDVKYHAYGAYTGDILEGYCILKLYREEQILRGHFIDLYTNNENKSCAEFLIQHGLRFFIENEANEVTLWMQGSTFINEILKKQGFLVGGISGGGWPSSVRPMVCRFNLQKERFKQFLKPKQWYFTMGDTLEIY